MTTKMIDSDNRLPQTRQMTEIMRLLLLALLGLVLRSLLRRCLLRTIIRILLRITRGSLARLLRPAHDDGGQVGGVLALDLQNGLHGLASDDGARLDASTLTLLQNLLALLVTKLIN